MSRSTHISKSGKEKEYYAQKIHKLDNDPTIDDSPQFPGSDSTEEDLSISETKKM